MKWTREMWNKLTQQEKQIMGLRREGFTPTQIAKTLRLSENTYNEKVREMFAKVEK